MWVRPCGSIVDRAPATFSDGGCRAHPDQQGSLRVGDQEFPFPCAAGGTGWASWVPAVFLPGPVMPTVTAPAVALDPARTTLSYRSAASVVEGSMRASMVPVRSLCVSVVTPQFIKDQAVASLCRPCLSHGPLLHHCLSSCHRRLHRSWHSRHQEAELESTP